VEHNLAYLNGVVCYGM